MSTENLPTHLSDVDRLSLSLGREKSMRIQGQIQLLNAELEKLVQQQQELGARIWREYSLVDADQVNFETGAITRAPRPSASPAIEVVPAPTNGLQPVVAEVQ
jgi:hypothetical protein